MTMLKVARRREEWGGRGDFEYQDGEAGMQYIRQCEYRSLGLISGCDINGNRRTVEDIIKEILKRYSGREKQICFADCIDVPNSVVVIERI